MENKKYTIEDIKRAFWKTFHKSGEIWFDYLNNDEDSELSTNSEWLDFLENIQNAGV